MSEEITNQIPDSQPLSIEQTNGESIEIPDVDQTGEPDDNDN
ncbi:MAG: hypothetical protein ACK5MU_03975 [Candidatus Saccharimonadales bacterium]